MPRAGANPKHPMPGLAARNAPTSVISPSAVPDPDDTVVSESVDQGGTVFAITWSRPRPPDVSTLLGTYFKQYRDAANTGSPSQFGLHAASVRASDVTVETAGHMGFMWGRAYLRPGFPRASVFGDQMTPRNVMVSAIVATVLTMLASADPAFAAANNVMNANVTHGVTGQGVEQPFGAIKVCVPGSTTKCQIISGLLIDTGSFGLRIFSQALSVHLPVQTSGADRSPSARSSARSRSGTGRDGRRDDGRRADDSEPAGANHQSELPRRRSPPRKLQPDRPAVCTEPAAVELQRHPRRGAAAVRRRAATIYYTCSATNCAPTTQPLDLQVQNPVALLPVDNNGVLLKFPLPPTNGASRLTGQLIFGVNTQANNMIPDGFKVYTANAQLNFITTFQNVPTAGFIDSGSNGYFYDNPYLPLCPGSRWYCPAALTAQTRDQHRF